MIKIGIVCFHNIRYIPFLNIYTEILDNCKNCKYEVIYFNRDKKLVEKLPENYISINWIGKYSEKNSKILKIPNFIYFQYAIKKIINQKKYDYIIVLTTIPGVLLSNYLTKKYENRYLIDVRDYTWEGIKFYYNKEKNLMEAASLRIVSSPDYAKFLPKNEYLLCHNINPKNSSFLLKNNFKKSSNDRIVISYIGSISYEKQCLRLIELVLADDRFEFHFYGNESTSNICSNKVKELENSRVVFHGPFLPNEKKEIYNNSDIIFNCYGSEQTLVKYAISNKYYDGALYHKPLIVSPNTTMEDISESFNYSLNLKNLKNLDDLYNWYININPKKFDLFCDRVIKDAIKDNKIFEKKLKEKLEGIYENKMEK